VLFREKDNTGALGEFTRASRLDPTDDELSLIVARMYLRLGQPEREREIYLKSMAQRPHSWQPYWWLASWHYRRGDVDGAVAAYREMIRRAPESYKGYSSLGGMLVLRGNYSQAIDTLKRALELRPTRGTFDNLGTAYFNSGRFGEAVDAYNQSFQFGVADYQSWVNLGDAYLWLQGRKDEADSAYAQAIRLGRDEILTRSKARHTEDVMIPANLATVFARLGQTDSARVYLERAVSADSANPMVQYCAALTHWQLGEKAVAIAWLQKSVHGGYPIRWLRDSPIFHEWRAVPEFRALVDEATPPPQRAATRS
jgi:serine/threonine-protein kinase